MKMSYDINDTKDTGVDSMTMSASATTAASNDAHAIAHTHTHTHVHAHGRGHGGHAIVPTSSSTPSTGAPLRQRGRRAALPLIGSTGGGGIGDRGSIDDLGSFANIDIDDTLLPEVRHRFSSA
jgi:hypothetical protein